MQLTETSESYKIGRSILIHLMPMFHCYISPLKCQKTKGQYFPLSTAEY